MFEGLSGDRVGEMRLPNAASSPKVKIVGLRAKVFCLLKGGAICGRDLKSLESELSVGFFAAHQSHESFAQGLGLLLFLVFNLSSGKTRWALATQ